MSAIFLSVNFFRRFDLSILSRFSIRESEHVSKLVMSPFEWEFQEVFKRKRKRLICKLSPGNSSRILSFFCSGSKLAALIQRGEART